MTFDDFRKQYEIFSKIDSAEKLALCESQYQKHLLNLDDENYFEPFESKSANDSISRYKLNLFNILEFQKIEDNQFYFLVMPSFEPEGLLIIEQANGNCLLKYSRLTKSYWTVYRDNEVFDLEKRTLTSELNPEIGRKIFTLLDKSIGEARQPKGNRFVLDGVAYILARKIGNEPKIVFKHSPDQNSRTGKTISILTTLIENIGSINENALSDIELKLDDLIDNS
jgi:hypothetical protein